MRRIVTALALLVLVGCPSSPPTTFYTLSPARAGAAPRRIEFPVQLTAVHLPPGLDRRRMVRPAGEHRVSIAGTDRWSAALDLMTRNVLAQDLAALLPPGTVVLPEAPPPEGAATLVVTLARFGPDASGHVGLDGSWSLLRDGADVPTIERAVRIDAGAAETPEAMAAAMSRALGDLAHQIAAGLPRTLP